MPEIRYYTVRQEREVKISANSPSEAVELANKVFNDEPSLSGETSAQVRSPIRERSIEAREDY